ncbi:YheU family protein [Cellvibrio mixtus]|uniref:YheU family protein n=1 Tax=Cellvibrio mixtus TaxID=39650 RepID=UPI0005873FCD|nr:YheU family protein [Cellvibrio mixtus]
MIIPYEQLSSDALQGLIEEFITREGTDYGEEELSLGVKVEQIKQQLRRREIVVVFDTASESVSILSRRDAELLE